MPVRRETVKAAYAIALDAALAELATALRMSGIRPLLIKGRAVAQWLYDDPCEREYGDIDLLVDPDVYSAAGATLARLGYVDTSAGLLRDERPASQGTWIREGERRISVDLHHKIFLIPAEPALAWTRLSHEARPLTIAGVQIDAPSPPAHVLILVLHAAQHGAKVTKPLTDVRRAIARLDATVWEMAGRLATELGAAGAMREGLQLVDGGRELADRLTLADDASRLVRLHARTSPELADGLEHLITTRGVRARLVLIARKTIPSPALLRLSHPFARRGCASLALAYLWRPLWLLAKLPPAIAAWSTAALPTRPCVPVAGFLAGAWWAPRAWLRCRTQLRRGGLPAIELPRPPGDRPGAEKGFQQVLDRLPATCLESSLLRQHWLAAHGRPRDLVIGVRGPTAKFGAHAWLNGDRQNFGDFAELKRWPPPTVP